MGQAEYLESDLGNISDYYKKMEEIENEQVHADKESAPQYRIWKFTRGDVIVMVIGGTLGGIFSTIVTGLLQL